MNFTQNQATIVTFTVDVLIILHLRNNDGEKRSPYCSQNGCQILLAQNFPNELKTVDVLIILQLRIQRTEVRQSERRSFPQVFFNCNEQVHNHYRGIESGKSFTLENFQNRLFTLYLAG